MMSFIIFACTKEGDAPEMKNSITYNNVQYDVSKGLLEYYGNIQGSGQNIDLILLSPGLTPVITNDQVDSITGIGNGIYFEIFTANSSTLDIRDYSFDATHSGSPGTFDDGNAIFNFNTVTGSGTSLDLTAGKLTVISNGPVYELTFKCTGDDGKSITGYYKGSLQYYDMSSSTRSALLKKRHKW